MTRSSDTENELPGPATTAIPEIMIKMHVLVCAPITLSLDLLIQKLESKPSCPVLISTISYFPSDYEALLHFEVPGTLK